MAAKIEKDEKILKHLLKNSIAELTTEFRQRDKRRSGEINFETFEKVINDRINLPAYNKGNSQLLLRIFNNQKDSSKEKINYFKFAEDINTFQFINDINIEVALKQANDSKFSPEKGINVFDIQKVPVNQAEQIMARSLKVSRLLEAKYKTRENFDKNLKENVKSDKHGNVASDDLANYLMSICKDELTRKELNEKDLEGFLSSLDYNKHKTTDINLIAPIVFSDEGHIPYRIGNLKRTMPPPDKFLQNNRCEKNLEKINNARMREVIKDLQLKTFSDKTHKLDIFREYDHDGDGYVSHKDIKDQFRKLKVNANDGEIAKFIELADPSNKGFIDLKDFSSLVTPNMVEHLVPVPADEENYLFRRDRLNLVPNKEKINENLIYQKTFCGKYKSIIDRLSPDKYSYNGNFNYNERSSMYKIWINTSES